MKFYKLLFVFAVFTACTFAGTASGEAKTTKADAPAEIDVGQYVHIAQYNDVVPGQYLTTTTVVKQIAEPGTVLVLSIEPRPVSTVQPPGRTRAPHHGFRPIHSPPLYT